MSDESALDRQPRWKVIYDTLHAELDQYAYGSDFYTLDDICRKFGVSVITARRVLDELEGRGLVQKIRGRGTIVRRVSKEVSVRFLIPENAPSDFQNFNQTFRQLVAGASTFASRHHVDFDTLSESYVQTLLNGQNVNCGVVIPNGLSTENVRFIQRSGIKYIMLEPRSLKARPPHVRLNRHAASAMAVQHLAEQGHRRIALICGFLHEPSWRQRFNGYRDGLRKAGLKFRWERVRQTRKILPISRAGLSQAALMSLAQENYFDQIDNAFNELMAMRQRVTAIIAGDDNRAIRLLHLCQQRGIHVPDDLSIIGFPNHPESKMTSPPLTVIDGQYEQLGEAAMQLLLAQMLENADPATQSLVLPPKLIIRNSVAPPADAKARTPGLAVGNI